MLDGVRKAIASRNHRISMHEVSREEPESAADGSRYRGSARKWIALGLLAAIAVLAWSTIDPGKIRSVVLLLLLMFAVRVLLAASSSR